MTAYQEKKDMFFFLNHEDDCMTQPLEDREGNTGREGDQKLWGGFIRENKKQGSSFLSLHPLPSFFQVFLFL